MIYGHNIQITKFLESPEIEIESMLIQLTAHLHQGHVSQQLSLLKGDSIRSSPSSSGFPHHDPSAEPTLWDPSVVAAPFHNTPYFFQQLLGTPPPSLPACTTLKDGIKDQSLLVCSDGAYCPITHKGSHSWVVSNTSRQILAKGAGPNDGHPNSMSSYRTELGGSRGTLYNSSYL
jgi:hypothetical protein